MINCFNVIRPNIKTYIIFSHFVECWLTIDLILKATPD